jgi:glycosyltransferase involved in cell wall biosynthesis
MNIWLLTGEYPPNYGGGIATYSFHTAQMLLQRGHFITVFAASENIPGKWQIEEPSDHLRVIRFSANLSSQSSTLGVFARWSYDAALVLANFCRIEGPPDVLESQEYLGMPYFSLQRRLALQEALTNLPILVTTHTPLYICRQFDQQLAYKFPWYWIGEMERFSMLAAEEVVFPSQYLRNEVEKDLPQIRDHSRVIANPYQWMPDTIQEEHNKKRKGFLFTAKLERRKGIEPLLSTFSKMWDEGLDEPLFLAGSDWFDESKKRWMSEIIRKKYRKHFEDQLLHWEGKQPPKTVLEKLNEVRAMILPSLFDNYPYAVLEAMAVACPVIVSHSGGHVEIIEDGKSGFIFSHHKKGDLEEKIQAVTHLTTDEQEQIVSAAQVRVKQLSGYEVIAPQKEEALQWARNRLKPRKCFPILRQIPRQHEPNQKQKESGESGLLSIVIPFFNLGNYLEDALKSLQEFTEGPIEIIVIDDGSDDPLSLKKLDQLHELYEFRLEHTQNQGLAITRNTGARLARGEFLAFLDADDYISPAFYSQALKILKQYENISYVGCWVEYFGDGQGYWPTWSPELPYALVHNPMNTGALVYRSVDFIRYGLNDPTIKSIMEDYDSLLNMLENGCFGVALPDPYHKYRVRNDSMFHSCTDEIKIFVYQQIAHKHKSLYSLYAEDIFGIVNCNGPGYLFDNPTRWYPEIYYKPKTNSGLISVLKDNNSKGSLIGGFYRIFVRKVLRKLYSSIQDIITR